MLIPTPGKEFGVKAVCIKNQKEYQITIRKALNNLRACKLNLDSARAWGIVDICGGGIFVTMMKQTKLEEAINLLRTAMRHLQSFRRENDHTDYVHQDFLRLGEFAISADYLLDNPITDIYVQSRINDLRKRVDEAIISMEYLLEEARVKGD